MGSSAGKLYFTKTSESLPVTVSDLSTVETGKQQKSATKVSFLEDKRDKLDFVSLLILGLNLFFGILTLSTRLYMNHLNPTAYFGLVATSDVLLVVVFSVNLVYFVKNSRKVCKAKLFCGTLEFIIMILQVSALAVAVDIYSPSDHGELGPSFGLDIFCFLLSLIVVGIEGFKFLGFLEI